MEDKCEDPLIITVHSLEQALELTGNGKFQMAVLIITGLSIMTVVTEGHCMAYVLPAAKCDLKISTAEQGFMNSVGFLGVICASHFWGFLADTWGRRKVLQIALLLAFVTSLVSSLSVNSWMLMSTRFASGLSMAGVKGTGITYLGEFMSIKNRPRYLAYANSFIRMGLVMQPLLGLLVLTQSFEWSCFDGLFVYKPWRLFLFISSLYLGFGSFGMMFLPESPKFQLAMEKPKETLDILRKMYAFNTGNPEEKFPVKIVAALDATGTNLSEVTGVKEMLLLIWNQTAPLFCPPYLKNMLMICGSTFAIYFVIHGQEFWYPQILSYYSGNIDLPITICEAVNLGHTAELIARNTTNALNSTTVPASCTVNIDPLTFKVTITIELCCLASNIFLILVIHRLGTKTTLTPWLLLNTISVLAIIWSNQFFVTNIFMAILHTTSICGVILAGFYGDLFPTHLRAMAVNMIVMFGRLGSVVGINFVAAMIFRFCDTLYAANFLIMLLAVGVTIHILWKCK